MRWFSPRRICFIAFLLPLEKEEAVVMRPLSTRTALVRRETRLSISLGGHLGEEDDIEGQSRGRGDLGAVSVRVMSLRCQ